MASFFTSFVSTPSATSIDRGLLLLRLALGIVFVMHGWQKIFVYGLDGVAAGMGQLGLPLPGVSAVLISTAEFFGGLSLLAGLFTRVSGIVLAFSMLVATASAHLSSGFFLPTGYEFTLTLMLANLAVAFTGAGAYSLDARIFGDPREATVRPLARVA